MAKRTQKQTVFGISRLAQVTYELDLQTEKDDSDSFTYDVIESKDFPDEKLKTVVIDRRLGELFWAKLTYEISLRSISKSVPEKAYDIAFQKEISRIADRASFVLSTLTLDSFGQPFITPPFFEGDEPTDE